MIPGCESLFRLKGDCQGTGARLSSQTPDSPSQIEISLQSAMQLNFTNHCACDQLFAELVEAGIPVLAVYHMGNQTTRVAVQDWARLSLVNAVVAAHVPGEPQAPNFWCENIFN